MKKLLDRIGGGGTPVEWETRSCSFCGKEAQFPASIIPLTFTQAPAICDACEMDSKHQAERTIQRIDPVKLFEASGVPDCPRIDLHPAFAGFIGSTTKGLLIFGQPGAYKTSNAAELVRNWSAINQKPSLYLTERRYFEACWDHDRALLSRYKTIPLLIVDDLGSDHQSDWSAGNFYDLVDARYTSGKKTVWITNHEIGELANFKHFDDRIIRRIIEMCHAPVLLNTRSSK